MVAIPSYSEVLFLQPRWIIQSITSNWVAIPSYSEVLFLPGVFLPLIFLSYMSRNPFLFRGPIPTKKEKEKVFGFWRRNPFLFRGPIPTFMLIVKGERRWKVAIPSYSEVLFLLRKTKAWFFQRTTVAIPSYSEVLFLHNAQKDYVEMKSQSLLIQRSYSYTNQEVKMDRTIDVVAIPSYSEVLFLLHHR